MILTRLDEQLTARQIDVLNNNKIDIKPILFALSSDLDHLDEASLSDLARASNFLYRDGARLISDHEYDHELLAKIEALNPEAEILLELEEEGTDVVEGKVIDLSSRMLSTDKAYSDKKIGAWAGRITKAAEEAGINIDNLAIEITPKLDGFAALDDAKTLCTRGNGYRGTDISRVFERGLQVEGGQRGQGPGEIVVDNEYFEEHLINDFENTRNFQASVIKEKALSKLTQQAIDDGAVLFVPFSTLPRWSGQLSELIGDFETIVDEVWGMVPFDVDGVVIEAPELKDKMGHTARHHRNAIAFKRNEPPVPIKVLDITFQTSKNGKLTPVAELDPTRVSNVIISRATLHNIGWMEAMKIGPGAVADTVRSGLVIPRILRAVVEAEPKLPSCCSSCGSGISRNGDNLYCDNKVDCPAQVEATLKYFFDTIGSCDGFGDKTLALLNENGANSLEKIFQLTEADYRQMGMGEKTANNLISELLRTRQTPVEDWRFLASFSLSGIGRGGCESVLKQYKLADVFELDFNQLMAVEGFAEIKSEKMLESLAKIKDSFDYVKDLGFNLTETVLAAEENFDSPIAGKTVVFTGSMQHGKRDDMKKQAKELGAKVTGKVTKTTDYLVTGKKVGENKKNDAKALGTEVIKEEDYLKMIGIEVAEPDLSP